MDHDFETSRTTQPSPVPPSPDAERPNEGFGDGANDRTGKQIHDLSTQREHDSTRESIRKLSDWTLSEALGLPVLAGDKPSRTWGGNARGGETKADAASNSRFAWPLQDEPPQPFRPGQSLLAHFSKIDRLAFCAAAAMMLLPLIGGDIFSR